MNKLSSDERLPLYQRLRDSLAEQIANNRWRPGEAIPTEAALSAEYGLSTGTVRKAIDLLVSDNILERQQGRGTFIRRAQFQSSLFRFSVFKPKRVNAGCRKAGSCPSSLWMRLLRSLKRWGWAQVRR